MSTTRLHLREARILEMGDGHRVIALALGLERVADEVRAMRNSVTAVSRRRGGRGRI